MWWSVATEATTSNEAGSNGCVRKSPTTYAMPPPCARASSTPGSCRSIPVTCGTVRRSSRASVPSPQRKHPIPAPRGQDTGALWLARHA